MEGPLSAVLRSKEVPCHRGGGASSLAHWSACAFVPSAFVCAREKALDAWRIQSVGDIMSMLDRT